MKKPKILYIEDNVDNRTLVRRILVAEGFEVMEAPDGASGLRLIQTTPPDLILMDINFLKVDGYE